MKKGRERSKSAGHILQAISEHKPDTQTTEGNDIRSVCRRVAPYITHQWREVCEELGVPDDKLDRLIEIYGPGRKSDLAFQGLCLWMEQIGRFANTDKLLRAVRSCGLRRAEDELKPIREKKLLPCFAKPSNNESVVKEVTVNRHAKQKALADRLSRPKSRTSDTDAIPPKSQQLKRRPSFIAEGMNQLLPPPPSTRQTLLCEVKVKVTINGIKRKGNQEVESTRDNYASTKDDYKHVCHTFVKLVMSNQQSHFKQLKHKLGFKGVTVLGLDKVGFNIQLFMACFNLGALETLLQSFETERLKKIMHSCLIRQTYLDRLDVDGLELSVTIDESLINRNREVIIARSKIAESSNHPIEEVELSKYLLDDDELHDEDMVQLDTDEVRTFDLQSWHEQQQKEIEVIGERLRTFLSTVNDFVLTLRILKPAEKAAINSLKDIIGCFHHIRNAKHLKEGEHSAVVEEYLAIVNQIRLKVEHIHRYDSLITFHSSMTDTTNELFHIYLHELDELLDPGYEFQLVVSEMEKLEPGLTLQTLLNELKSGEGNTLLLSSLEKDVYGGCLCYIPALVGKLLKLSDVLQESVKDERNEKYIPDDVPVLDNGEGSERISVNPLLPANHADNRCEQAVA